MLAFSLSGIVGIMQDYIEAVAKAYHVGFEDLRKLVGKKEKQEVRISEKLLLSINEANALSGIG